jgi:protein O-mannosyl-transferase
MSPRFRSHLLSNFALPIIAILMILSAYSNTLNSPPVLDDFHSFVFQRELHTPQLSLSTLVNLADSVFSWRRMIPLLTLKLDYFLGHGELKVFHLTNIFIHILAFFSVYFLTLQLTQLETKTDNIDVQIFPKHYALLVASLWALQPVHTNAVTYLVQRMASIQAFFYVLSVALYIQGRRTHQTGNSWKRSLPFYVGCAFAGFAAAFSKELTAMLPLMLIATEVWFFRQSLIKDIWLRLRRSHWSIWLFLGLGCLIAGVLIFRLFQHYVNSYDHRFFTLYERLLTEARVVVWYISLLILPLPSRLSLDHDIAISTSVIHPISTLYSIVFIGFLFWMIFRYRRRFRLITYGMLWFFMNLAIESTILPLELIFEHRLYLPSVGFTIAIITFLIQIPQRLSARFRKHDFLVLTECTLAIALSFLTLATFIRNEAWENSLTIQYDSVSKAPQKPRPHANLAVALFREGLYDEAIEEAETALRLGKGWNEEYAVAGQVVVGSYLAKLDIDTAIRRGEELLSQFPLGNANAGAIPFLYLNLARSYLLAEELQKAFQSTMSALDFLQKITPRLNFYVEKQSIALVMRQILAVAAATEQDLDGDGSLDPGNLPMEVWIAQQFLKLDEKNFAKELLEASLARNAEEPESLKILAVMKQEDELNRIQRSNWNFSKKYVRRPFSRFNLCMATAFLVREKQLPGFFTSIGENCLDYALKLRSDSADAHLLKAWYHFAKDESNEAVVEAKRSLELDPNSAKAWLGLGFFTAKASQPEEAIAAFQKTLQLYPGYSHKASISRLIASLQKGEPAHGVISPGPNNEDSANEDLPGGVGSHRPEG